jgi:hypothetical protein
MSESEPPRVDDVSVHEKVGGVWINMTRMQQVTYRVYAFLTPWR